MICFARRTVLKALHRGERMQSADKTAVPPLYPVYRIMHSMHQGSSAARLSNLMSSCSKWNVSGSCQDESFCLFAPRFDQMAAKILVVYVDVLGRRRIPWMKPLKQTLHRAINVPFEPECSPRHMLVVFRTESQGESEVSLRGVISARGCCCVFVGGERYKPLSESWYQLNPFTIYIFTSTSLLASQ